MRRRTLIAGAAALTGIAVVAGYRGRQPGFDPRIPAAPTGEERVVRRRSRMRGTDVDFYTAVPSGHGTGHGLPVCVILHGGTAGPADFPRLGFGRFLTDSVRRGTPPFVLAGASGGTLGWRPSAGDDPQRLVHEEVPLWCRQRGFDTLRQAVWGWDVGGAGALTVAEANPRFYRAVAAFAPAVHPGDDVFVAAQQLRGTPVGLWCGTQEAPYADVQALVKALPEPPAADARTPSSASIPAALDFLGRRLRDG